MSTTTPALDSVRLGSVVYSITFDGATGEVTDALAICDACGAFATEIPAQTWSTCDESQPYVVDIMPSMIDRHDCPARDAAMARGAARNAAFHARRMNR